MFPWRYFWMRLTLQSGLWLNQIVPHNVGEPYLISWRLWWTKTWPLVGKKELCSRCLWTWATASPFHWIPSLPAHSADFGLSRLHSIMNQFLKINPLIYTHPVGLVLWRFLTYTLIGILYNLSSNNLAAHFPLKHCVERFTTLFVCRMTSFLY